MNQFDDIFKKKLNEDQLYDNRKGSWLEIDKRLNAYQLGSGGTKSVLKLWQVLSLLAVFSAVALFWERQHILRENQELKIKNQHLEATRVSGDAASLEQSTTHLPFQGGIAMSHQPVTAQANKNSALRSVSAVPSTSNPMEASAYLSSGERIGSTPLPHPITASDAINATVTLNLAKVKLDTSLVVSESVVTDTGLVVTENVVNADSFDTISVLEKPDTVALAAPDPAAEPIQQPVKSQPKKWRLGVRVLVGVDLPKEHGVSAMRGQGIGLARQIIPNLSATASADFLKFDLSTDSIPHNFADAAPPPPPGPNFRKLKNVASNQLIHQYSLGLSYSLPLAKRWSSSFNLAHTWAYRPSRLVSYRFEKEPPHGGPTHQEDEFLSVPIPKKWISAIWKMGVGFHFETPDWSLGVIGDYSRSLKQNRPTLEAAYVRAEALYKF